MSVPPPAKLTLRGILEIIIGISALNEPWQDNKCRSSGCPSMADAREEGKCQPAPRSVLFLESLYDFLMEPMRIEKWIKTLNVNGLLLKGERLVAGENTMTYLQHCQRYGDSSTQEQLHQRAHLVLHGLSIERVYDCSIDTNTKKDQPHQGNDLCFHECRCAVYDC